MKYKLFEEVILDTEDRESVGNFIGFLGILGIALFILFGLFCWHWIAGCIGIFLGMIFIGFCLT